MANPIAEFFPVYLIFP